MHFAEAAATDRLDHVEVVRLETAVHDQAARLLVALDEVVDAFLAAKRWYVAVRVDRLETVLAREREEIGLVSNELSMSFLDASKQKAIQSFSESMS